MPYRRFFFLVLASAGAVGPALADGMNLAGSAADNAYLAAMQEMTAGVHKAVPTGDVDADFARIMLPHHQAAVDMAKAELQFGKDEGLKAVAKEIVTAQEKEIAIMKAWEDRKKRSH